MPLSSLQKENLHFLLPAHPTQPAGTGARALACAHTKDNVRFCFLITATQGRASQSPRLESTPASPKPSSVQGCLNISTLQNTCSGGCASPCVSLGPLAAACGIPRLLPVALRACTAGLHSCEIWKQTNHSFSICPKGKGSPGLRVCSVHEQVSSTSILGRADGGAQVCPQEAEQSRVLLPLHGPGTLSFPFSAPCAAHTGQGGLSGLEHAASPLGAGARAAECVLLRAEGLQQHRALACSRSLSGSPAHAALSHQCWVTVG